MHLPTLCLVAKGTSPDCVSTLSLTLKSDPPNVEHCAKCVLCVCEDSTLTSMSL